ncbi:sodium channel protein Nach [Fopius arisanus]|uniref:Sodium channel protein Nach n=2 Tax=Fopius arisanus TaxID=64838 RepID=A0A9R1T8F9_9HYME|nr:PREDICTED: sodium channel protein Nach [Fopius arisanus]
MSRREFRGDLFWQVYGSDKNLRHFWGMCTLAAFGATLSFAVIILIKYLTEPMFTVVHIPKVDYTILFPAVIACPSSEYLDLRNYTEEEAKTLRSVYDWNWKEIKISKSLRITPDLQNLFEISLPNCRELFTNCEHMGKSMNCSEMFTTMQTFQGKCCATSPVEVTAEQKNRSIKFTPILKKRMNMYFRSNWFLPRGSSINYRLIQNMSFTISMQITTTASEASLVNPKLRGCILPEEGVGHSECQLNCQRSIFTDDLGCIPWWMTGEKSMRCRLTEYNKLLKNISSFDRCHDNCPLECNSTWYNIDRIHAPSDDTTSVSMSHWPLVTYERKVIFGILELIVAIGGILGLFMGYSLLVTVEQIYFFTIRSYCGAVLAEDEPHVVNHVEVKPRNKKHLESYNYGNFYIE